MDERVLAERDLGDRLIQLAEGGRGARSLSEYQLSILRDQPESRLRSLGLSIEYEFDRDRVSASLRASDRVGSARFASSGRHLDVVVEPKVSAADFLQMTERSGGALRRLEGESYSFVNAGNPSRLILESVLTQIRVFLQASSYRAYHRVEENSPRPRGRLDIAQYAQRSLPRLRNDRLPCSYFDFSADVFENRVLARTALIAGRIASNLPSHDQHVIRKLLAEVRSNLRGVTTPPITPRELDQLRYHGRNERFEGIHQSCRLILDNVTVSLTPGRQVGFSSFAIHMGHLFERYVLRLIRHSFGPAAKSKADLAFPLGRRDAGVELDGLLDLGGHRTVIECKYKIIEDGTGFLEELLNQPDMYQAIAYSRHRSVDADSAILVYPTIRDKDAQAVAEVGRIDDFGRSPTDPIGLRIVMVNLSSPARRVAAGLANVLRS